MTELYKRCILRVPRFKLANGLIGQEEGVIVPSAICYCSGGYNIGDHTIACHHSGAVNLTGAVQASCNTYFCKAFYNIVSNKKKYKTVQQGYQAWKDHINALGFRTNF